MADQDDTNDQMASQPLHMNSVLGERVVTALNLRGFGVEHVSVELHPDELVRAVVSVYLTREMAAALFKELSTDPRNER